MAKAKPVLLIFEGLIFLIFGLNFFLHFLPMPPPPNPQAGAFMMGLFGSGYFFYLLKFTEVICGALLLANMFVPIALLCLSPIVLNIFCYHTFLDHSGLPLALVIVLIHLGNFKTHWNVFKPLLKKKV